MGNPLSGAQQANCAQCKFSSFDPKRPSLALGNDCTLNDLRSILLLLIGVVQSARVGHRRVQDPF
jgi:hypothetical protein